jgi:hypothetical protein
MFAKEPHSVYRFKELEKITKAFDNIFNLPFKMLSKVSSI